MLRRMFPGWMAVVLAAMLAASLACEISVGGPTPPASPIAVSTEAAGQLLEVWQSAIASAANGQVSVIVTEAQLTSFVNLKLAEQENPPLRDVQVYLRDSRVTVYGTARATSLKATAAVVLAVNVTPEGQVLFSIEKAEFGPLPVPVSLLESLSGALNEAFTGQFGSLATGIRVSSVLIADGNMGIIGELRR